MINCTTEENGNLPASASTITLLNSQDPPHFPTSTALNASEAQMNHLAPQHARQIPLPERLTPLSLYRVSPSDFLPFFTSNEEYHPPLPPADDLPTIEDVVTGKTRSPLSIQEFSEFLQQRNAEDYLEFLLAMERHEALWRTFRQQDRKRRELERRKTESEKFPSVIAGIAPSGAEDVKLLAPLKMALSTASYPTIGAASVSSKAESHPLFPEHLGPLNAQPTKEAMQHQQKISQGDASSNLIQLNSGKVRDISLDTHEASEMFAERPREPDDADKTLRFATAAAAVAAAIDLASTTDGQPITERDVMRSGVQIYDRFCSSLGTKSRAVAPEQDQMIIQEWIEVHRRADPVVFSSAKKHVCDVLNTYYFPTFLDQRCSANVTRPVGRCVLLPLGVVLLIGGIALEIGIVLVGVNSKLLRLWCLPAVVLGWTFILSGVLEVFPLLALLKGFEYGGFHFRRIHEASVLRFHTRRAIFVTGVSLLLTVVTMLIFVLGPGSPNVS
ncbi:uncharacterized protein VTP21DRAFT_10299 [Calcarisporiella thermophila]|uniref:uncharacterized protein n=1 Tax=Calcarisporiella thermophila TaxID=911321 RepID=UPI0037422041